MLDSTTVQFAWDPPLPSDETDIRGVIKGYQVSFLYVSDVYDIEIDMNRLKSFDLMIRKVHAA